jgi:hypothetical protein
MDAVIGLGLSHLKDTLLHNQIITMEDTSEVLSRLKFIGCIAKDEKIDVRHVKRQPDTMYTKFNRCFLYPDNRINTLKFLRDVLNRSFEIVEMFLRKDQITSCKTIINDLVKAKQGMLNLKYTYSEDTKFCCDMDVLIESVNTRICFLKETYPNLFEEEKESV